MIILVSNDDGVDSPGIKELARAMKRIKGARVVVVAPAGEQSATSHSLTLHRPLRIEKMANGFYAVDGTPTDAVTLAIHRVLRRKPDLIISGINRGANLGEDVHYSGTVAAALEGAIMGIPAIAVSVAGKDDFRYDVAGRFAKKLVMKVLKEQWPPGLLLNVNVPSLPADKIKGYEMTILGRHDYGDVIVDKLDPRGRPYYWIGSDPRTFADIPGSDCRAITQKKISVTPVQLDMTDHKFLNVLQKWKL